MRALASASCVLLAKTSPVAASEPWDVEAALLIFTEFEKVSGTEAVLSGRTPVSPDAGLTLGTVIDVLVGASPNGATPSNVEQTFTTPSGFDNYQIAAGDEPLDDTFQDNRLELSVAWDQRYSRKLDAVYGAKVSMEFDYMSVGADTRWNIASSADTSWALAAAVSHDRVHPVGGVPIPFASMQPQDTPQPRQSVAETKNVFDVLLGVTQVLGARTVVQFNYSHTYSDGYHTDPYKLVSVVAADTGSTLYYIYEQRPDMRTVHAFFSRLKHRFDYGVLDIGARYTEDDWGVTSGTVDVRMRKTRADNVFWEPHLRWYSQSAADFFRHSITDAETLGGDLSADRRLAGFDAVTLGLRYGRHDNDGEAFSVDFAYYHQFGDGSPDDAVGVQRGLDLFPETHAILVQLTNTFFW
jgi:hypothetical protein